MKTIKYISAIMLSLVFGLFFTSTARANTLQQVEMTMNDSRPSTSTSHAFTFNHTTGHSLNKMTFQYCKKASTTTGTCATDLTSTDLSLTSLTSLSFAGVPATMTDWSTTTDAGTKTISLVDNAAEVELLAGAAVSLQFNNITNATTADNCDADANADTDTCFVWIKTYSGADVLVDSGTATYTIVNNVQVTARVDPTFSFVVAGVAQNIVTNGITTSVTSSATTLPFGSLTSGVPKYAAHSLYVTTNASGGYFVTAAMYDDMTGVNTDNNIDKFTAPWTTPADWTIPTGNVPNANTGWIGANTSDADVEAGAFTAGKFAGIDTTPHNVSQKNAQDNGLAPVYVTYAIETNVFQASDYYTGYISYNAIPTY